MFLSPSAESKEDDGRTQQTDKAEELSRRVIRSGDVQETSTLGDGWVDGQEFVPIFTSSSSSYLALFIVSCGSYFKFG